MDNQDYHGFKFSLEIHMCFRGRRPHPPRNGPRTQPVSVAQALPWGSRSRLHRGGGLRGGECREGLADWPWLNWEDLVYCFVLGFVSFEKQETEPFYDMDFTA